jgi:arylsulfatase A-like enzyme
MPALNANTADWERRDVLAAGAATNGVFPAIYTSSYPDRAYDEDGSLVKGIATLPGQLSAEGYATAGFVASNPFLGKWSDEFGTFWNDGMTADTESANRTESTFSKGRRLITFEPRVRDADVLERARDWWASVSGPRFAHVHLMGPHAPYYPGIGRAWRIGALRSYLSILGYAKRREDLPIILRRQVKQLYDQCIVRLDEVLSEFLQNFPDSPLIVLTADHGEEFGHGRFGHARLYNETTRCPYLTNDPELVPSASAIRQVDIAPTILNRLGVSIPNSWEGQIATYSQTPLQPMWNKGTRSGREWFGVHDETKKLIENINQTGERISVERYRIGEDPKEQNSVEKMEGIDQMERILAQFKNRFSKEELLQEKTGLNETVDERLRQLGYR